MKRHDLNDSDLQGLEESYRAVCAQRRWASIIEEADPPQSWLNTLIATVVIVLAVAACAVAYAYFWFWGLE